LLVLDLSKKLNQVFLETSIKIFLRETFNIFSLEIGILCPVINHNAF